MMIYCGIMHIHEVNPGGGGGVKEGRCREENLDQELLEIQSNEF